MCQCIAGKQIRWQFSGNFYQNSSRMSDLTWTAEADPLREGLARKDLNWSVMDPTLYNEAFTGRTRSRSASRMITCQPTAQKT